MASVLFENLNDERCAILGVTLPTSSLFGWTEQDVANYFDNDGAWLPPHAISITEHRVYLEAETDSARAVLLGAKVL